jgi:hypothetical protein
MRLRSVALIVVVLAAAALLPGIALADEGGHAGHGPATPVNPLLKQAMLFLTGDKTLDPAPPAAAQVPAGAAGLDGTTTPVIWSIKANKNAVLDSSVYLVMYVVITDTTLSAGGPDSASFRIELGHNGKPVDGASTNQKLADTTLLLANGTPNSPQQGTYEIKAFLPKADLTLAPGDTLEVHASFYGLNPEARPSIAYKVGGSIDPDSGTASGSRIAFRLKMTSMNEVLLPELMKGQDVRPLEGFDFREESKKDPSVKEFTLRAYQFAFDGAPIVVPQASNVVLHMYVDESLSKSTEGHAGHAHAAPEGVTWDTSYVNGLHGFSLAALRPGLQTALSDGVVVTMKFTADKPGNYTLLCSVFCGGGHGNMTDRLTILGAGANGTGEPPQGTADPTPTPAATPKAMPGFESLALAPGLGAAAWIARRRRN